MSTPQSQARQLSALLLAASVPALFPQAAREAGLPPTEPLDVRLAADAFGGFDGPLWDRATPAVCRVGGHSDRRRKPGPRRSSR